MGNQPYQRPSLTVLISYAPTCTDCRAGGGSSSSSILVSRRSRCRPSRVTPVLVAVPSVSKKRSTSESSCSAFFKALITRLSVSSATSDCVGGRDLAEISSVTLTGISGVFIADPDCQARDCRQSPSCETSEYRKTYVPGAGFW